MKTTTLRRTGLRVGLLLAAALFTSACAQHRREEAVASRLDPALLQHAVSEAKSLRARGGRVWCVPFARNASGVEIRGNAETWWSQAAGHYLRGKAPRQGAVMAFSGTRQLPMGHVAVVSKVISEREITISHANWKRNQVSLDMPVIDISEKNDWSRVRVMSVPGNYGRPYKIDGFILAQNLPDAG
ncbi:CHAP domain-containing protein [Vannielia sp.]|uniref:CHAP domain-containing protein n=1 Tax=Vannielia sp. TaxID=2813045 RepID=UPI00262592CE|nr:CHAP domain-containing protein [Vannielia sp.]MDF1872599.1 CHAP domain-containing protein [Vannielia sp.]